MEALERRCLAGLLVLLCIFCSTEAQRNSTRMSYVCPAQFLRLGHSCYYFSETKASWQNALFACKDRDSMLSVPARWEDRNLRKYLTNPKITKESRWIGGIYDHSTNAWRWGGELRKMHYQSFSKMKKMKPEELQFHCIAMMPELLYRWAPRPCIELRHYICQTKLRKVPKSKVKDLKRRWQRGGGKINEITVPSVSHEVNDPMVNDVTHNPVVNSVLYDSRPQKRAQLKNKAPKKAPRRPNELRKRPRPVRPNRRLTRPFPGYTWNRRDPEGSYKRNAGILQSGSTGLTAQQVRSQLERLARHRDRQLARRRRLRQRAGWLRRPPARAPALSRTLARTYTVDNNISALHPKTIVEEFDVFPQPIVVRPARTVAYG